MFCETCGTPLREGAQFCVKCGTRTPFAQPAAPQPEPPAEKPAVAPAPADTSAVKRCPRCNAPLRDGMRFCTKCGYDTQSTVSHVCPNCGSSVRDGNPFCSRCGKEITAQPETVFCRFCGKPMSSRTAFCATCGKQAGKQPRAGESKIPNFNEVPQTLSRWTAKMGGQMADARAASLGWKHVLTGALFLLMIIFWYVPVFQVSSEGWIDIDVQFLLGDILRYSYLEEYEVARIILIICALIFDIVPLATAWLYCLRPIMKKSVLKRRRMIWPTIVIIWSTVKLFTSMIVISILAGTLATLTGNGVFLLIMMITTFVLLQIMRTENKQIMADK